MPKLNLVAVVTVIAYVDGQRQEFVPGSELPELPEHDVKALLEAGAIRDVDADARAEKAAATADRKAGAEFQAARRAQQTEQASIAPPATSDPSKPAA
ncbi:hypothetical protein [uncultured Pseudacidovorax sp.]|uniref:hypothetical protein n=1 Tax=uncultured Pseudacidovorax sp. TaxID=679313 RepID=UPI0025FFC65F|nr:hypothetical protein [uncultured Pseudacidovorax sp.]